MTNVTGTLELQNVNTWIAEDVDSIAVHSFVVSPGCTFSDFGTCLTAKKIRKLEKNRCRACDVH